LFPNRFLGVVGAHIGFPIQHLCLSNDRKVCASISYDECVKFWNVEHFLNIKLDASSKSKSKKMKNKKLSTSGKAENFFSDLCENKDDSSENDSSSYDDSSNDEDDDDDQNNSDSSDNEPKTHSKKKVK
jgi:hypothetical protein